MALPPSALPLPPSSAAQAPVPSPPLPDRTKRFSWFDVFAGLSLAGLLLPEAVAYSSIANLPPEAGVIALFAGLVCYGLIGTSRFAIVSATSSSAAVLAAASATLGNVGGGGAGNASLRLTMAMALVLMTGLLFTLAAAARIGSVSDFIAKPVLRGFAFGLALVIILKQFAGVVGAHLHHTDVIRLLIELFGQIGQWHWPAVAMLAVALVVLLLCARIPHLPGGLVVIVLGIAAGRWIDFHQLGIGLVGSIALQLHMPALPALAYTEWLRIAELGVAMLLILYAESYSSIRTFAMKHGDAVAPNRDLLALGVANLVSGLFHGVAVGAGFSGSSANDAAGAVSKLAGWCAALTLLVVVLTLLPMIALTPEPILAAIVMHAVSHTLRLSVFKTYFFWRRDRFVIVAAVVSVLMLGVLHGLLAAIAVSLVMLLRRLAESSVSVLGRLAGGHDFVSKAEHPDAQSIPGMLILRPDTALFFANADRILAQVRRTISAAGERVHIVILSLEESPDLDSTAVEAIGDFYKAMLAEHRQLYFARLKTPVQAVLSHAAIVGLTMAELIDLSVDDAVEVALQAHPDLLNAARPS